MMVAVELVECELWREFHQKQNEMIITKAGRCLFPLYRLRFHKIMSYGGEIPVLHLEEQRKYQVSILIEAADDMKWKWRHGRWAPLLTSRSMINGRDEGQARALTVFDIILGSEICKNGINLDKLKITNRESSRSMTISLQSFHRYIPLVRILDLECLNKTQYVRFAETEFIAVTHYQNELITLLKKSYNPHAKGFVITDDYSTGNSSIWTITSECSPQSERSISGNSKRARKRIRPLNRPRAHHNGDGLAEEQATIPSDEEELQGSIALQLLADK